MKGIMFLSLARNVRKNHVWHWKKMDQLTFDFIFILSLILDSVLFE